MLSVRQISCFWSGYCKLSSTFLFHSTQMDWHHRSCDICRPNQRTSGALSMSEPYAARHIDAHPRRYIRMCESYKSTQDMHSTLSLYGNEAPRSGWPTVSERQGKYFKPLCCELCNAGSELCFLCLMWAVLFCTANTNCFRMLIYSLENIFST